jgi:hypothetical protein
MGTRHHFSFSCTLGRMEDGGAGRGCEGASAGDGMSTPREGPGEVVYIFVIVFRFSFF